MSYKTFLAKFDQFVDEPEKVDTIRSIIYSSAVTGRLSEPHPSDAPVAELLLELDAGMANGLKRRKRYLTHFGEPLPPDSAPLATPDHWAWVPLNRIGSLSGGLTPSKNRSVFWDGDLNWFSSKDIKTDELNDSELKIAKAAAEATGLQIYQPGCLVMVARSGILKRTFPVSILRAAGTVNQDLKVLAPYCDGLERYLQIMFRGMMDFILTQLVKTGMTVQSLKYEEFEVQAFPLPPLAEQKRIVAKVDELMVLCDRLEAQLKSRDEKHATLARAALARFAAAPTPANLELVFHDRFAISPADLRNTILSLAVQGNIVLPDPNDDPAEEILAGIAGDIAKAVRAKRMRNSRPIPVFEVEYPIDLPAGWAWAPLGRLTAAEDGAMCDGPFGSKLKTEHYITTKGYAVLRLGNIGPGYFIHGKEGHISREHFESLPGNHIAPGDLLVAGLADPLVRCCEVPPDIGPAVNKSDCFRVRLSKRMNRSYIRHYLNSPIAKAFAAKENHGMTRERINLAGAKALPVSVPPLAEQRRIVAKVDQLMALVDKLEAELTASRATADQILAALVAELTAA